MNLALSACTAALSCCIAASAAALPAPATPSALLERVRPRERPSDQLAVDAAGDGRRGVV